MPRARLRPRSRAAQIVEAADRAAALFCRPAWGSRRTAWRRSRRDSPSRCRCACGRRWHPQRTAGTGRQMDLRADAPRPRRRSPQSRSRLRSRAGWPTLGSPPSGGITDGNAISRSSRSASARCRRPCARASRPPPHRLLALEGAGAEQLQALVARPAEISPCSAAPGVAAGRCRRTPPISSPLAPRQIEEGNTTGCRFLPPTLNPPSPAS